MSVQTTNDPTIVEDHSTGQKRAPTAIAAEPTVKRPTTRSNNKTVTDFLLDEDRIGSVVHVPNKKRRYVNLKSADILDKLSELYTSLFKQRWSVFGRSVDKFTISGTQATSHYELCAYTYLSHWTQDLYRMIRESLLALDPVAFNERYHHQVAVHSTVYDHFLATLTNHLKPTHITMSYADEVYIPILSDKMDATNHNVCNWRKFHLDFDLFSLCLQILDEKKLVTMTPLSNDLLGRPSWLFDWEGETAAYAWFPQEANYNDEDVAIAYILGVACSPKLAHADFDEWKISKERPNVTPSKVATYIRAIPRRWKSSAEFRVVQLEEIHLPNYYEKDKAALSAGNVGPYAISSDVFKKFEATAGSSTSGTAAAEEEDVSDSEADPVVLESPRASPRLRKSVISDATKAYRTRVIDYMYYKQVILRVDSTTRYVAFRMFTKYN